jgi:hypothetical protein
MVIYNTTLLQFDKHGEKTGWTYIEVPHEIAEQLKAGCKKSFKVKGKIDSSPIAQVSLLPMGNGNFILPVNAALRKAIAKRKGAAVNVQITEDKKVYKLNEALLECLNDEPAAFEYFKTKPQSFQNYYNKWIESAKTEETKAKRIAMAVSSLAKKIDFGEMLKMQRDAKNF